MSSRPTAAALPPVASQKASVADRAPASDARNRASWAASRISSQRSRLLFDAGPSVPRPTWIPRSSMPTNGAIPAASFALLCGQCATPTPYSAHRSRSASLIQTQCAASIRPPRIPWSAMIRGTEAPCSRSNSAASPCVSATWMCSSIPCSRVASAALTRMSTGTVYAACGPMPTSTYGSSRTRSA